MSEEKGDDEEKEEEADVPLPPRTHPALAWSRAPSAWSLASRELRMLSLLSLHLLLLLPHLAARFPGVLEAAKTARTHARNLIAWKTTNTAAPRPTHHSCSTGLPCVSAVSAARFASKNLRKRMPASPSSSVGCHLYWATFGFSVFAFWPGYVWLRLPALIQAGSADASETRS